MKNVFYESILLISLFCVFGFWLFLLFGLAITSLNLEIWLYVVVAIFGVIGLILTVIYMKQTFWKPILLSILLSASLISFALALLVPMTILDQSAEDFPPRCEIVSPNGDKIFVVKALIPSESLSDVGWIYYKNIPFIGKSFGYQVRSCESHWIDNDTIAAPANSYSGDLEQVVSVGLGLSWSSSFVFMAICLVIYLLITSFGFILRRLAVS